MAIINVDDAHILNETGAQVDKTTGIPFKNESLTDAEAAQARANIRAGGTNPNLLDNPFFTVRQRGNGPFSSSYSADRWFAAGGGLQVTLGDGGATLVFSSTYRELRQYIENPTYYANGTYTMSVKVTGYTSSGEIRMQVHDGAGTSIAQFTFSGNGIHTYTFTTGANGIGRLGLYNILNASATMTVEAVKLERGSVSTLANDVPPELITERSKCQAHALVLDSPAPLGSGYFDGSDNTTAYILVPTPTEMRAKPTVSHTSSIVVRWETSSGTMGSGTASSVSVYAYTPSGVILKLTVTGITGIPCVAYCPGVITLSSDL